MGSIIDYGRLAFNQAVYRLLVYSSANADFSAQAVSVNKLIASELVKIKPNRRTIQLEKCFVNVLNELPDQSVIKDIDVLFNPSYKVDVMKLLISAFKQKPFSLIWPGAFSDGKLFYSEEGFPDYRVYEISDYDIMFVI